MSWILFTAFPALNSKVLAQENSLLNYFGKTFPLHQTRPLLTIRYFDPEFYLLRMQ